MATTRTERLAKQIRARTDGGEEVVVYEYVTIIETTFVDGSKQTAKGTRRYALADGSAVKRIDEHTLQVVKNDQTLREV